MVGVFFIANLPNSVLATQPISLAQNDEQLQFDIRSVIEYDRILVPFRAIFEALGALVLVGCVDKTNPEIHHSGSMEKATDRVPTTYKIVNNFDIVKMTVKPGTASWLHGSLVTGEYRIVKDILVLRGSGYYVTYYLAAELIID